MSREVQAQPTSLFPLMVVTTCITMLLQVPQGQAQIPSPSPLPTDLPGPYLEADIPGPFPTSKADVNSPPWPRGPLQLPLPNIPGLLPSGTAPDVMGCWSSVLSIPGCGVEIFSSVIGGQFGHIGPLCCKAFVSIQEDCWAKLLPISPFSLPTLKNICSGGAKSNAEEDGSN